MTEIEEMERLREEKLLRDDERDRVLIREIEVMIEGGLRDRSELRDFSTYSPDRANIEETEKPINLLSDVDKLLDKLGLLSPRVPLSMSKKAIRRRKYYIRKREKEGKPYIPASTRALGKEAARNLGHKKWEVRLPPSLEEQTIHLPDRTIDKLRGSTVGFAMRTRIGLYLKGLRR